MKEIPLRRGMVALVDDEDYETVAALGKWQAIKCCASATCDNWYARKSFWVPELYGTRVIRMHTLIMGAPGFDHINGDGLDNRRANLRAADSQQNARNRRKVPGRTSIYKGVSMDRKSGRFRASIDIAGKTTYLGAFDLEASAARAYDAAAIHHFGEFARPNFPLEQSA